MVINYNNPMQRKINYLTLIGLNNGCILYSAKRTLKLKRSDLDKLQKGKLTMNTLFLLYIKQIIQKTLLYQPFGTDISEFNLTWAM